MTGTRGGRCPTPLCRDPACLVNGCRGFSPQGLGYGGMGGLKPWIFGAGPVGPQPNTMAPDWETASAPVEPPAPKRMDEMRLADFRRGVENWWPNRPKA